MNNVSYTVYIYNIYIYIKKQTHCTHVISKVGSGSYSTSAGLVGQSCVDQDGPAEGSLGVHIGVVSSKCDVVGLGKPRLRFPPINLKKHDMIRGFKLRSQPLRWDLICT